MGFPCNQFGAQQPGDAVEITNFVEKYGVKFPLFQKLEVNGKNTYPLYCFLRANSSLLDKKSGMCGLIPWNFAKFVVNRNGEVIKYAHPKEDPNSLRSIIEEELKN